MSMLILKKEVMYTYRELNQYNYRIGFGRLVLEINKPLQMV